VPQSVFDQAQYCLQLCSPEDKVKQTREFAEYWRQGKFSHISADQPDVIGNAGRPEKPQLVQPKQLPKRSISTEQGRVILAHALAHIEFNAINLALDAVYRFRDMPEQFYADWIKVADEEAYHFGLLNDYIQQRGHAYGDYTAHNGLWEMAQ